ncbi:hypothetical protein KKB64_05370 [Patescibacteria group bacterium]|nr:hypothetical protein [Patescibacteria group bacterium]MBU1473180.1 hypothetical protein [Patescibacteria group bacterium]MBU2459770.1 hypothetical protein [Patescibacteria group bacterium]MBU2544282.1 hypothetical protein [Patescibacteria group bacterium]
MKIQDIAFVVVFLILLFSKKPKAFVWAGLACLVLAIPLFAKWIFFTAERLTWYAAAFFLASIIGIFIQDRV